MLSIHGYDKAGMTSDVMHRIDLTARRYQ